MLRIVSRAKFLGAAVDVVLLAVTIGIAFLRWFTAVGSGVHAAAPKPIRYFSGVVFSAVVAATGQASGAWVSFWVTVAVAKTASRFVAMLGMILHANFLGAAVVAAAVAIFIGIALFANAGAKHRCRAEKEKKYRGNFHVFRAPQLQERMHFSIRS